MENIKEKIKAKIQKQIKIKKEIEEIEQMLENHSHLLTKDEIKELFNEKEKFEAQKHNQNNELEKKYKKFFYSIEDIKNAPSIKWLIDNVIPKKSIGVFIGKSGSGKSTVVINFCKKILNFHDDIFIIYIDGDMDAQKIKESDAYDLMQIYKERFQYAGKNVDDFSEMSQELLKDTINEQLNNPSRAYLIVEDSLSLIARKRRGFIDTENLYKYEKKIRELGGTTIIIHHTNKSGVFADTQHIENFADYTYMIERNEFNSCVLLHPQKASRYDIKGKAFFTKDRVIVNEVEYEEVNIEEKELVFIKMIIELLEDGEMNQSEIIKHLNKIRFFTDYKIGQKKAIKWLSKYAKKNKWKMEKRPELKNATFYYLSNEEKLKNMQNSETK